MSVRLLKRIVCFHSNDDFGVTTHLESVGLGEPHAHVALAKGGDRHGRMDVEQLGGDVGERQVRDQCLVTAAPTGLGGGS